MTEFSGRIAAAFKAACLDELDAPKPGNVHVFAKDGRKTVSDFRRSAEAAAAPLCAPGARVGASILGAVRATRAAVGTNTNLGIILLCAPLAAAANAQPPDLRAAVAEILDRLDTGDADLAFQAIALASPGGIGRAERHDVFEPAKVSLKTAMVEAAERDRIARQYACAFEDVFNLGERTLQAAFLRSPERRSATLAVFLGFLATFPDSHIVREHGIAVAEEIRRTAMPIHARLESGRELDRTFADILAWDKKLKQQGVNPGTSADLTVATLFAHRLRNILPTTHNND